MSESERMRTTGITSALQVGQIRGNHSSHLPVVRREGNVEVWQTLDSFGNIALALH